MSDRYDLSTIPGWLREMRRRRKWSQRDIANHLGMTQSAYCRWESIGSTPLEFHQRILAQLGREVRMPPFPYVDVGALKSAQGLAAWERRRENATRKGS